MDCSQFEELFHDLDRPGTDGYAARESVLAHAEACSRCGQLLTHAESLDLALSALSARENGERAPAHLETLLREEFRHGRAAASHRRVRWQIAALATAAAMLVVLGLSLHHRNRANAGSGGGSHSSPAVASDNRVNAMDVNSSADDSVGSELAAAESQAGDSESATAFVPLPYADDSASADGGTIVRVELSRPQLASLGLPVTDMADTDRIAADIVLSEDGAPQAIRLVSRSSLN